MIINLLIQKLNKMKTLILILTLIINYVYCDLIVNVNEGKLKGKFMVTKNGKKFEAFTGIPFAEPPLGPLRFKPPVPKSPWNDIKDASKAHNVCPQIDIFSKEKLFQGEEDCLYLNVYTPSSNNTNLLLPVMFFIHGGAFAFGSAMVYQPEILLDREIVLVVINYRLGALGFLSTGDEVVPGNNGLKDQNVALRWVKDNIRKFGGDPDKITLFGESAGGASVNFHMLSPLSKDLIFAAISQSGTAMCPWAISPKGESFGNSKKLATIFNCSTENNVEMINCLREVDPIEIVKQDYKYLKWDTDPIVPFKPVVEPEHEGAFLSAHPADIIKAGKSAKIPWLTGINTEEGSVRAAGIFGNSSLLGEFDEEFNRLAPISLLYDKVAKNVEMITNKIKKFYFDDKPITNSSKSKVIDLYTDAWFIAGADESVRYHLEHIKSPIYYYLFGYRGTKSIFGDLSQEYGVSHADELQYLFPINDKTSPEKMQQESDIKVAELLTKLWANFAKTGNPTPETDNLIKTKWMPVKTDNMEYYYIRSHNESKMSDGLFIDRAKFWRDILNNDINKSLRNEL